MKYNLLLPLMTFLLFGLSANGQSKKEYIEGLNQRIDSLNRELVKANKQIKDVSDLQEYTSTTLKRISAEKDKLSKTLALKGAVLDSLINVRRHERSLLRDSFHILLRRFRTGYVCPYKLRDTAFIKNGESYKYFLRNEVVHVIIDTTSIKVRKFGRVYFHFIVPIVTEDDISNMSSCPSQFGLLATDEFGSNLVFEDYWTWERVSQDSIKGNIFNGFHTVGLKESSFTLLSMNESACGSGGKSRFYKIHSNDGNIGFTLYEETEIGYSDLVFFDDKDYYVRLKKINPQEHFGPAIYSIEAKRISDGSTIFKRSTKSIYDCFTETNAKQLLETINYRENILTGLNE
jgi:hypothetical protein